MAGSLASVGRRRTTIKRRNIISVYLVSVCRAFIGCTSNNLPISLLTIVANMIWTTVVAQSKPIKTIQWCRYFYFTSSVCSLKEGYRRTLLLLLSILSNALRNYLLRFSILIGRKLTWLLDQSCSSYQLSWQIGWNSTFVYLFFLDLSVSAETKSSSIRQFRKISS